MNVGDLKWVLQDLPDDMEIVISLDGAIGRSEKINVYYQADLRVEDMIEASPGKWIPSSSEEAKPTVIIE